MEVVLPYCRTMKIGVMVPRSEPELKARVARAKQGRARNKARRKNATGGASHRDATRFDEI
jgi:hypothetical protein